MRGRGRWDKLQPVQVQGVQGELGRRQMSQVRGIEGTAVNAQLHAKTSPF